MRRGWSWDHEGHYIWGLVIVVERKYWVCTQKIMSEKSIVKSVIRKKYLDNNYRDALLVRLFLFLSLIERSFDYDENISRTDYHNSGWYSQYRSAPTSISIILSDLSDLFLIFPAHVPLYLLWLYPYSPTWWSVGSLQIMLYYLSHEISDLVMTSSAMRCFITTRVTGLEL